MTRNLTLRARLRFAGMFLLFSTNIGLMELRKKGEFQTRAALGIHPDSFSALKYHEPAKCSGCQTKSLGVMYYLYIYIFGCQNVIKKKQWLQDVPQDGHKAKLLLLLHNYSFIQLLQC